MQAVLSTGNDEPAGPEMRRTGCPCQGQIVPWLRAVELVQLLAGHPREKRHLHCRVCLEQGSQAALHPAVVALGCVSPVVLCHCFQFLPTVSQTKGIVLLALAQRAEEGRESCRGTFHTPELMAKSALWMFLFVQSGAWAKKML